MDQPVASDRSDEEICFLSALELGAAYRARTLTPSEVTEAVLRQIERVNPPVNAFVTITADIARAGARESDRRFAKGRVAGPLDGIPLGIKDLTPTAGIRTTRGSRIHEWDVPEEDAPMVERLKRGGAIILGKTNTPEFGWKSPTDNPLFGPTRNPWNLERTAAGSSGGSAAAVACGMGPVATGGDGGGSIRQPASFCGVFGIKPSFGLVPIVPPSVNATFVSDGPLSRTVRDGAMMIDGISGFDARGCSLRPVPTCPTPPLATAILPGFALPGVRILATPVSIRRYGKYQSCGATLFRTGRARRRGLSRLGRPL